ncbi:Efflux pump ustT [Colletotrichum aenigma]|uniref:Efflux pump ustT n=1 Tax=Colletotrichum aenigma TaxID=1215731 RepID=UPI001872EE16|nr:Efflux pump ustT [Colletotrichum aenigma]KAF5512790.1 Efflux pump ustT [Colletotrichum aenigma]
MQHTARSQMSPHANPSPSDDDTKPCLVSENSYTISESSPLLSDDFQPLVQPQKAAAHRSDVDISTNITATVHEPKNHRVDSTDTVLYAVILLFASSAGLWTIPTTRQVEDIVCRQHYGVLKPIGENQCKEDSIQSKVAMVFAIYGSLQAAIAAVAALPWGIVADRVGRKIVFRLAVLGTMLDQLWFLAVCAFTPAIPLNTMWVGSSLLVIGGGNPVVSAVIFSMLTDITTPENRAKKFMTAHLSSMIGNLGSPLIAGWMMDKTGPWPVMWLSLFGFATVGYAIRLIPETRPAARAPRDVSMDWPTINVFQRLSHHLRKISSLFLMPSLVILILAMLALFPITLSIFQFMIIFASRRYQIPTSQTGFLSFFYGFSVFIVITAVLPNFSKFLVSPRAPKIMRFTDSNKRDLFLARASCAMFLLGSLCMAVSPTLNAFTGGLALLSLASGWGSYARSLCALYVDSAHRTQLYSIMSLVETAGMIFAQPVLAGLFSLGMELGGFWIGLPYLGCACFCVAALGLLLLVRLPALRGG